MKMTGMTKAVASMVVMSALVLAPAAWAGECKQVHGDLIERDATEGCLNPARPCFLGELDANHGLRGVTHFQGQEGRAALTNAPGWITYTGLFHYTLEKGTLVAREVGVTSNSFVTAHHQILEGTGELAGATGYLFVSGIHTGDSAGTIITRVTGEICLP